jgi:hypothetical protein
MIRKLLFISLLLCAGVAFGQNLSGANGDCEIGGEQALTQAIPSTATQQIGTTNVNAGAGVIASFPNCHVTVFFTGTGTKANLFSSNVVSPPALSNPFTANADGSWTFFAAFTPCYDIVITTGTGPALPYSRTFSDVCLGTSLTGGSVTSVAADPTVGQLFTTTVSNPSTTPHLHFSLTGVPSFSLFGNCTSATAAPVYCRIVTGMLPFTYTGNTLKVVTAVNAGLTQAAGTPVCDDGIGNIRDFSCTSGGFVISFNGRVGVVTPQTGDYTVSQITGAAALNSPHLTGTPTTPTGGAGDTSQQIANDQWVALYFASLASPNFTGIPTVPTASPGTSTTQAASTAFVAAAIGSGFAPLNSPAFTGVPTAPTAAVNTNTTQIATQAAILQQASNLTPLVNGTGASGSSFLYSRTDHVHPTDSTRAPLNNPNFTGVVQGPGFVSNGSTFTSNAGCSETLLTGGSTKGSFKAGATSCTTLITMGGGFTAVNGLVCSVWDITTPADSMKQTTFSTTQVTLSGTVLLNDIIIFGCDGF